jgi:hypothetical protein
MDKGAGPERTHRKPPVDPSKYKPYDPVQSQKQHLETLFKNFEKPLLLPNERPKPIEREKKTGGPRSMSSSSRFHEYRKGRSKEYERLSQLDEEAKQVALCYPQTSTCVALKTSTMNE